MKRILLLLSLLIAVTSKATTYSGTLPVMFINTEGNTPITSKEDYLKATYYIDPMGVEGIQAIGSAEAPLTMQIRGRGNWTWSGFDKKPYRLKLDDKQPLLGMKKSKHFALLAHADDNVAFMRNIVGLQLSRLIGLPWTPADAPVEVVLNGDYIGLYFLTELVRVDKDRVNIVEQPDNATDPETITGGWLVEIDNYDTDPHIELWEKDSEHSRIVFTYKTPEVLSPEQEAYLTEQMTLINDAVYNPDLEDNTWEDYVDTDQLARYYIVQEVLDDYESFHGSCYLYKEQGNDKWHFGPVWDFGNALSCTKYAYIYQGRTWHNTWIGPMCNHPHFMEIVKNVWGEFYNGEFNTIYQYIDEYAAYIASAVQSDAQRWPNYGNADFDNRVRTAKERLASGASWLQRRWASDDAFDTYRAYFVDNEEVKWENVHSFTWYDNEYGHLTLGFGSWPGKPMQYDPETGYWYCEFKEEGALVNPMIIFNDSNGGSGHQTEDLVFVDGGLYDRTGLIGMAVNSAVQQETVRIRVINHQLHIYTDEPSTISIVDLSGRISSIPVGAGSTVLNLRPGFYIVNGRKILL
ncbi:MAG: CotH kinase family protein [Muribaculaceae bacterium]